MHALCPPRLLSFPSINSRCRWLKLVLARTGGCSRWLALEHSGPCRIGLNRAGSGTILLLWASLTSPHCQWLSLVPPLPVDRPASHCITLALADADFRRHLPDLATRTLAAAGSLWITQDHRGSRMSMRDYAASPWIACLNTEGTMIFHSTAGSIECFMNASYSLLT